MQLATKVQILNKAVCFSHSVNILRIVWFIPFLSPAMGKE